MSENKSNWEIDEIFELPYDFEPPMGCLKHSWEWFEALEDCLNKHNKMLGYLERFGLSEEEDKYIQGKLFYKRGWGGKRCLI